MRGNHAQLIYNERKFPTGHKKGYAGFLLDLETLREDFYAQFLETKTPKQPTVNEVIAAFGEAPPEKFSEPYDLTPEGLELISKSVQRKYVVRFKNIRRSWSILLQYMPELLVEGTAPRDVLEMSTAHGATLEILSHYRHRVLGNDFANFLSRKSGADTRYRGVNELDLTQVKDDHSLNQGDGTIERWPYQPIIESLGLDVRLFDAGHVPYPLDRKSFDTVMCIDALEHYCHPKDWMTIIDEFTQLARQSVLVITNPVQGHMVDDADYMAHFYAFQKQMRQFSKYGFQCVHAGINRNQLTVFKLARVVP
ncbi:MAG: class I SAM-dependent methyltransferase [Epibacterium sp.]|nr:class I SAM-dependent methyltransferase [Epibacterium sp.]NQX74712.1 hypothetical protein [Epibacterium sp.]